MSKKIATLILCLLFLSYGLLHAQINLVKNPGFEKFWHCPNHINEIRYAYYWSSIGIADTTPISVDTIDTNDTYFHVACAPEYCNTCATWGSNVAVPHGAAYFHYPHSGNGMVQMQMFTNMNPDTTYPYYYLRDYSQGRLYSRLVNGQTYCVSFYVVLEHISAWAINHIGAYLDDASMDTANWCGWPQTNCIPQVYSTSIISDTLNWTKIEGNFTATGNESFITIGNFFDSAHTDKTWTNFSYAAGINDIYTWYLVDDISVIPINASAYAGTLKVIPPGSTDSVWVGDTTGDYLPCYWYSKIAGSSTWVLIDSNISGFKVLPNNTTKYMIEMNVCGNTTYDSVTVRATPVGVWSTGNRAGAEVFLYPNPAGKEVTIWGAMGCKVVVYNMVGVVVKECVPIFKNEEVLDISGLVKGVYFVEVVDGQSGMKVVKKLVKE